MKTDQSNITVLQQLCKPIPQDLLKRVAKEKVIDKKARAFTPMSHAAAILFATHHPICGQTCPNIRSR